MIIEYYDKYHAILRVLDTLSHSGVKGYYEHLDLNMTFNLDLMTHLNDINCISYVNKINNVLF